MGIQNSKKLLRLYLIMVVGVVLTIDLLVGGFIYLYDFKTKVQKKFGLSHNAIIQKAGINIIPHPYRSYMLRPGYKLPLKQYKDIPHIVDELGHIVLLKDKDLWKTKKVDKEYRIFFLGGSTTGQPWPFYLTQVLNQKYKGNPKFKTINAGNGGYTSQENLSDLITSGFSYDPDMVIAYLPVNDINLSAIYPFFKRDYTHFRIPIKYFDKKEIVKPECNFRKYPFTLKLIDLLNYIKKLDLYYETIDLGRYVYKQPRPISKIVREKSLPSFMETVEAIVDNIYNMKILCEARKVKFVLITQKLFPENKIRFHKFITPFTLKAIDRIKNDHKLKGIYILEMHKHYPNNWNDKSISLVEHKFPNDKMDYTIGLNYDVMHFTIPGLYLFAAILSKRMDEILF
jgi:hypothetical protein